MTRVVFLGQKWLGERCFDVLLDEAPEEVYVVGAVSNENADTWWSSSRIAERARRAVIPFLDNDRRRTEAIEQLIRESQADAIVSVQHPWILPPSTLQLVGGRALNLHNAKLPEYAGHNASNHAVLDGASEYTSTVHWMVPEVDAGAIAYEETFAVPSSCHARGLYELALDGGERVFRRLLGGLAAGEVPSRPMQDGGRFFSRSSLDSLRDVTDIDPAKWDLRSRALFFPPFEPAFARLQDRKVYLLPDGFEEYAHEFRGRGWG